MALLAAILAAGLLAQDAAAPVPLRITPNFPGPRLVKRVQPAYPDEAMRAGFAGVVVVDAQVDAEGRVGDVRILRGIPLLTEPAVAAVRRWRYEPLVVDGKATPFTLTVTLSFMPGPAFRGYDVGAISRVLKGKDTEAASYAASFVADRAHQFKADERKKLAEVLRAVLSRAPGDPLKAAVDRALEVLAKLG